MSESLQPDKSGNKRSKKIKKKQLPLSLEKRLALYFDDILAIEMASLERLEKRSQDSKFEETKNRLLVHIEETHMQIKRLQELINDLDSDPVSTRKKIPLPNPSKPLGKLIKAKNSEKYFFQLRDDLIAENIEIVMYDFVIKLLIQLNREAAASILTQSFHEEVAMANWIKSNEDSLIAILLPDIEGDSRI